MVITVRHSLPDLASHFYSFMVYSRDKFDAIIISHRNIDANVYRKFDFHDIKTHLIFNITYEVAYDFDSKICRKKIDRKQ